MVWKGKEKENKNKEKRRHVHCYALFEGIGVEGLATLVAGVFGSGTGTTSYSENIGAIGITKVTGIAKIIASYIPLYLYFLNND